MTELQPAVEQRRQPGVIILLALGHALLLLLLQWGQPPPDRPRFGLFQLAWVGALCGQISLAAIFIALAPLPLLVRLPLGGIAGAAIWNLMLQKLGFQMSPLPTGAWAMAGLQFGLVLLGAWALRLSRHLAVGRGWRNLVGQFRISTLLAWTTLVAVSLAALRLAIQRFGWNQSVLGWEWFAHLLAVGVCNALIAVIGVASVLGEPWSLFRRLAGLAMAAAIVVIEPFLVQWVWSRVGAEYVDIWLLGTVQISVVFLTLFIVRFAGGLAEAVPAPSR